MTSEAEQIKQRTRDIFDLVASGYDNPAQRFFPFCADRMIQLINLQPGEKVLDIATGTGMAAIAAAQRVIPDGRVHGIDLSENMLAKAKFNCDKHALDNVDLHLMDAEQLIFRSNYFDVITCGFGLFFLPDMTAALQQWLRVLKPGGRLIFTSFTQNAFMPYAQQFRQGIEQLGVVLPTNTAWQRLVETATCQQLVTSAGFVDVQSQVAQMGYHLASENDWWELISNSGFRRFLDMLNTEQQLQFREQHLAEIAQQKGKDGLWLDVEVIFTQARKAN